ncbi:hypothetical protein SAY86_019111 [Trapa natans]|uniref:Uncharacterized protein n=1 Tax=Trapa natans TaxID=22666 RepID=A0AAN7R3T5_TRANT|nr:hypothetical protein SAY86_018424 [Trapa natans]KAK4784743.1 hypothetical protein SAY86_019111 [Trapa natans]
MVGMVIHCFEFKRNKKGIFWLHYREGGWRLCSGSAQHRSKAYIPVYSSLLLSDFSLIWFLKCLIWYRFHTNLLPKPLIYVFLCQEMGTGGHLLIIISPTGSSPSPTSSFQEFITGSTRKRPTSLEEDQDVCGAFEVTRFNFGPFLAYSSVFLFFLFSVPGGGGGGGGSLLNPFFFTVSLPKLVLVQMLILCCFWPLLLCD